MKANQSLIQIEKLIYFIRNQKVMLSHHLAELYEVEPRILIQAVKRNIERFPADFMFQLNEGEQESLRSQFVILEKGRGKYPKYLPYAFTEQGVAMLSSVLRSKRAIQVNIEIMRTFTRLRELLLSNKELSLKLSQLEKRYDSQFKVVFDAIRQLMTPQDSSDKKIGFKHSQA